MEETSTVPSRAELYMTALRDLAFMDDGHLRVARIYPESGKISYIGAHEANNYYEGEPNHFQVDCPENWDENIDWAKYDDKTEDWVDEKGVRYSKEECWDICVDAGVFDAEVERNCGGAQ